MRQIIEVVRERRSVEDTRARSYVEWQTRALASFIAATAMSEDGAKELQKAAMSLSILPENVPENVDEIEVGESLVERPEDSTVLSTSVALSASPVADQAGSADFDPSLDYSQVVTVSPTNDSNKQGSFEKLAGLFV